MCEYCGCQNITAIGDLTQEHDALVALIADARGQLADNRLDAVAGTCHRMLEVLQPHAMVEEDGLFPELAGEFPKQLAQLRDEHRIIDGVLSEGASGAPFDPDWPARLQSVLFILRDHILKEQDGVFPAALTTLDGNAWERVEAVRARSMAAHTAPVEVGRFVGSGVRDGDDEIHREARL